MHHLWLSAVAVAAIAGVLTALTAWRLISRRVERDLQTVIDVLPSIVAYWDRQLINRFANHAHRRWYGLDGRSLRGRHLHDCVDPQQLETVRPHIEQVLRGEAVIYERAAVDFETQRPTTLLVHYLPDRDENEVRGFYVMAYDIGPLKEAEHRYADSERFLERAEAISGLGGFQIDLRSGRRSWTRQTFNIFDVEGTTPLSPEQIYALMTPEIGGRFASALELASTRGTGYDLELPIRTARGRPIWIHTTGVVELDDGAPARVMGAIQDVTERKRAELALAESEFRFRSLFELSPVGMALTDLESGRFLQLNAALAEPTGYSREELLNMTHRDLTPAHFQAQEAALLQRLEPGERYGPYEREYRRKNGDTYAVLLSGIRTTDSSGRPAVWSIVQDISLRKAMESELADAARRDKLTGLANRALFMERLEQAVLRVNEGRQSLFAVLFLDFDRFKLTNDTLGHEAGDELLRQIAGRLRSVLRTSDARNLDETGNVVSRFGGDEFLLLINDLHAPRDAVWIAERLLNALASAYDIQGREVYSTASIGIVTSDRSKRSAEDVVRNADVAMYEAKRAGRACSVVFNEVMHTRLTRHVAIENSLRRAIGTDELYLLFQPIVDLRTREMISAEALVRWNHPNLGLVSPAEFIPIAEESGLIVALGQWVQNAACEAMASWRQQHPENAPATVSVNISRAELALGDRLLEQLRKCLERHGLPAHCLQLEVTEREFMRHPEAARSLMLTLQQMGVKLAMDDFGTGTSSLGFLRSFPFNTIKIDGSFVKDVAGSTDVLAVMHATINLVENLGMSSVAEGVEEATQVAILQSLGCRYAQGNFFSDAVSADLLPQAIPREPVPAD